MKKLRLVRERKNGNEEHPNDVRGLNDMELFHETGIQMHLWTDSHLVESELQSIGHHYDVSVEHHPDSGLHHFWMPKSKVGNHKRDALKLFFCAMEILQHESHVRVCIFHENGLEKTLKKKLFDKKESTDLESIAKKTHKEMQKKHSCLSFDGWVHQALHQSGIVPSASSEKINFWDMTQVHKTHETLVTNGEAHGDDQEHEHTNTRPIRKTG